MFGALSIAKYNKSAGPTTTSGMFGGQTTSAPAATGYVPQTRKPAPRSAKPEPTAKGTLAIPVGMEARPDKTFFNNYVNGPYTQTPGIGAIDRAYADGRTYQQIYDASLKQGFTFETGSYDYLMDKLDTERRDNLAAEQAQKDVDLADTIKGITDSFQNELRDQEKRNEEQLKQLQIGQSTFQQNQARSNRMGALQIAGASQTPRTGGTQGFKRRPLQINPVTANALSGILGGTKAATTTNTLNV